MSDDDNAHPIASRPREDEYALSSEERERLQAMTVRDPDDLLAPRRSSVVTSAVGISVLCHVAILAVTSIALFADWQQRGVKLPAAIRAEKKQEVEAEKQAERDAKIAAEREALAATANTGAGPSDSPLAGGDPVLPGENDREKPATTIDLDDIDLGL